MKRFLWSLAAAAALATPSAVLAQEEAAGPNTGGLSLSGGVDYTTAYFFRGYLQEDSGLILQPYVTINAAVAENDNLTVNAYLGTWNSFHENKTLAISGPSTWYESDLFGGIDFAFGDFTIGAVYTFYTYPNGAFETIQELGLKLAYDDTNLTERLGFSFSPYVAVYFETSDGNGTQDAYGEVGISPSFIIGERGLALTVPVVLGFSIDDYYFDDDGDDEFLGYGSIGLFASIPLPFGDRYGSWTLTGGAQYVHLFADSAEAVNDGDRDEIIGKVGLSFTY